MRHDPLAAEIGKQLRAFRIARRLRQDDVVRAAGQAGLPWTRSVVVGLEAGRRYLTIDEFARLPLVLERLGVAIGEASVRLENLGGLAQLRVLPLFTEKGQLITTNWVSPAVERMRRVRNALDVRFLDVEAAYRDAGGELEQKTGRRLRLDPLAVAVVARRAWGHSLTEERDRRVTEQAPPGASPRALQARRGHVSRALLEELAPRLAEARTRWRRRKGPRR